MSISRNALSACRSIPTKNEAAKDLSTDGKNLETAKHTGFTSFSQVLSKN